MKLSGSSGFLQNESPSFLQSTSNIQISDKLSAFKINNKVQKSREKKTQFQKEAKMAVVGNFQNNKRNLRGKIYLKAK